MRTVNVPVTASVPYFGASRYIRRAVESLLAQTHRNLTVVVINDGDPRPPWPQLAHIRDPRLVRLSLDASYGPYFAHQLVFAAARDAFVLIQDADDWSAPERASLLLEQLTADAADFAFSAEWQLREQRDGSLTPETIRWSGKAMAPEGRPTRAHQNGATRQAPQFLYDPYLTDIFANRASHHGIFRRDSVMALGGYYGGYRINYDMLLTNLLLMTGKASFLSRPLYHYVVRQQSLSHASDTGVRSALRKQVKEEQGVIYRQAFGVYRLYLCQRVSGRELNERIREISSRHVNPELRRASAYYSSRLRRILRRRPSWANAYS
jgi:glycosyltransferase involved in cell wall biosynthesis